MIIIQELKFIAIGNLIKSYVSTLQIVTILRFVNHLFILNALGYPSCHLSRLP